MAETTPGVEGTGPLTLSIDAPVARITLNRPTEANALNQELADEFERAAAAVTADPAVRIVVLRGTGPFFSAGGDVRAMAEAEHPGPMIGEVARTIHRGLMALARSEAVLVAAVNGTAAGAGLGLLLNAQLSIATSKASFVSGYAGIGVSPDCGVSYLLPRVVGSARAGALLLGGRVLSAAEALQWGLVSEVVEPDDFDARVEAVVAGLANGPLGMLGVTKRLSRAFSLDDYEAHLDEEAAGIAGLVAGEESRELVQRFVAKSRERAARKPKAEA